jgi:regulator of chromosome condensation
VTWPRLNDLLREYDVVQVATGGLHCIALTENGKVLTWGVNDDGALGRDTEWRPLEELAGGRGSKNGSGSGSGSSDSDLGLNPKECIPTPIAAEGLGEHAELIVQVVATDSASFALTVDGLVYGWGTFKVNRISSLWKFPC